MGNLSQSEIKRRWFLGLVMVTLSIILAFHFSGSLTTLEQVVLDFKFQLFQREDTRDEIVLVTIDQKSLDQFSQLHQVYWPWPREFYALVQDFLAIKGAKQVVIDLFLDQPDFDRPGFSGNESDLSLASSMVSFGNTIVAVQAAPIYDRQKLSTYEEVVPEPLLYSIGNQSDKRNHKAKLLPVASLLSAVAGIGDATVVPSSDGIIRSVDLFNRIKENSYLPSLSMSAYLKNFDSKPAIHWDKNQIQINGDIIIPLDKDGKFVINWYSKGGVDEGTFPHYSFYGLFKAAIQTKNGDQIDNPLIDGLDFKGKTVFIGASAPGLADIKATPMSSFEPIPGVEIQATILNNLLDGIHLKNLGSQLTLLSIFLIVFGVFYQIFFSDGTINIISNTLLLILVIGGSAWLFDVYRYTIPTVEFTFAFTLSLIIGYSARYLLVDKSRYEIQNAFHHYVQKEVVDQMIEHPELLKLSGQNREMTVIFGDLAGFTTASEKIEPEKVVAFLNNYMTEMTNVIFEYGGTLDKYMGDGIIAFWGAPVSIDNHAEMAAECCIEMTKRVKMLLKDESMSELPKLDVRFGISTGKMVVGNMGSANRFNYTVIGDSVNLASRLESANNIFETSLLISEKTAEYLSNRFYIRELDRILVKGKSIPQRVYELIGLRSDPDIEHWDYVLHKWNIALQAYYIQDWGNAKLLFSEIESTLSDDGPVKTYLDRIEHYKLYPVTDDWDGVIKIQTI